VTPAGAAALLPPQNPPATSSASVFVPHCRIYGLPTYRFNEAFKRNRQRFPDGFEFQLIAAEFAGLKLKPAISKAQEVAKQEDAANSSQFVISSKSIVALLIVLGLSPSTAQSWRRRC
jgi:hypothetical protein